MPRKGHHKSRNGCVQCKHRHIKCDEARPQCRRCVDGDRQCIYGSTRVPSPTFASRIPSPDVFVNAGAFDQAKPAAVAKDILCTPSSSRHENQESSSYPVIEFVYLELFYNFEHETSRTITRTKQHAEVYCHTVISRALAHPHLMYAILGVSALHLASCNLDTAPKYRQLAAVLQGQALEGFNASCLQDINASNVMDLLLFQHTTALHVFCDIFGSLKDDSTDFLDRLVGCVRLLQGINSVIQPWWSVLSQTELGIIMQTSDNHQQSPHESRDECNMLKAMANAADLSNRSIEVCLDSISRLQSYFDSENELESSASESTNMLFSWLVTASVEYIELLDQRRPEALVILAYYAVLLHRRKGSWAVKDSGSKLLQYLTRYLGKSHHHLIAWPNSIVNGAST